MFLKQLDVVGFKSFAERISMEFVPGVTAVVGPNGSGKSNIIDAIRWVLGEQSAKSLRGGKMEDVIFSGSDTRKSLNFAEVSLTLDNEQNELPVDYNEVNVMRRVYRSGDSEFFINNQSCRLKDIVELFMDSGLGREAFSIISQGKVDEILNSKPDERRSIFEEAAGVLKYKTRKKKAESKLEETQENLYRVNDILSELEHQVEPLQIQASIAKDFLEKKTELEQIEVAVIAEEIEQLHSEWNQLKEKYQVHIEQEQRLSAQLKKSEAEQANLKDKISALDDSITELQNVLLIATEDLEKLEGRKEVLKERKKNASQNQDQLLQNIEESARRIEEFQLEKEKSTLTFEKQEAEITILKKDLQHYQTQLASFDVNIDQKIDELKSEYIDLLNEQTTYKNELNFTKQQIDQQVFKNKKLEQDNMKHVTTREEILEKKEKTKVQLKFIQEDIQQQLTQHKEIQNKLDAAKDNHTQQESALYKAYQFIQKAKSRKETLEEMQEDYSGFFQGVKEILKAKAQLTGIEGAVAELIEVPKTYQTAIETALGAAMQHIIVVDEASARKAISYLKEHRYGRATFLPMTVVKKREVSVNHLTSLRAHPSFLGVAADLINVRDKYAQIVSNLLGTVIIAKDLKGANELAKFVQYRYRFVTLEGDVVNPGGSMTGGTVKQTQTSILSRKTELEELNNKLVVMEQQVYNVESAVKELKQNVETYTSALEEARKDGEKLRFEEHALQSELRQIEMAEKNENEHLKLYDLDKKESTQMLEAAEAKIAAHKNKMEKLAVQLQDIDKEIATLSERKTAQVKSKDTVLIQVSDLKAAIAVKNEQYMNTKQQLLRLDAETKLLIDKHNKFSEELDWLKHAMTSDGSGEAEIIAAATEKGKVKQETAKFISIRRQERMNFQHLLEENELATQELRRQQKGIIEGIKIEEIKLNRLDVELENRLQHLRNEYTLSFEAAKEQYPLTGTLDTCKKKVKLIKLSIEELGTVNLGAIEEYDRVFERFTFLKTQQEDLLSAKNTLHQVIDEMDEEMKRKFADTFHRISTAFEPVFQALFGGGSAHLRLTDPEDLLRTGVDIVAQPPGKKLQNLSLLSGGERALTAIALLFAILRVRPVPFCILDEVEAALDEANVYRFSQYLKNFSEQTQFIVITHRKGTMEEADVLYGITMQESGVSKLVSVKLEDSTADEPVPVG